MIRFRRRLAGAWEHAERLRLLALVPAASSLLDADKLGRVLGFDGVHVGVTFRLPTAVADVWTFVSVPGAGIGIDPELLLFVPALISIEAGLAAGYLGSIASGLAGGGYDFVAGVRRYGLSMLGYTVLAYGLLLASVGLAALGGRRGVTILTGVMLPAQLALGYLFYATPYLIVIRGRGLVDALAGSYRLAVAGGDYFVFALGYLALVAALSVVATAVVANLGAFGVLLGIGFAAPVALTLTIATMEFVEELDAAR